MPCKQKYTEALVQQILEYSEGDSGKDNSKFSEVETLYGKVRFKTSSDEQTGHAMQRHLTITPQGLRTRTMPKNSASAGGIAAQDLDQASAFGQDDMSSLLKTVTAALNSSEGQEALGYLDLYEAQGKTRFALVVNAADIGCGHVNVRVFYQDRKATQHERLQKVCVVIDSNLGGKFPIKIITAFPCKDEPKLEVGLSAVTVQAADLKKSLTDPAESFKNMVRNLLNKPRNVIPANLLSGEYLKIGKEFNSGWFKPNPDIYDSAQVPPKFVNWPAVEEFLSTFCDANGLLYMTRQSDNAILATTKKPVGAQ